MMGRSGFTLIELMIVIAIIGILAAVAIPNFMNARDRARVAATVSSIAGVHTALEIYVVDASGYPDIQGSELLSADGILKNYMMNPAAALKNFASDMIVDYHGGESQFTLYVYAKDRANPNRTYVRCTEEDIAIYDPDKDSDWVSFK